MKIDAVADRCQSILAALSETIVGKATVLEQILAGVLADGHILIEDYPGWPRRSSPASSRKPSI